MWDTSDLASEALARTARRIAAFDRSRGTFRVFLRMILNNCLLDVIRSVDRRPVGAPLLEDKPDPAPSPLEQAMAAERRERYLAALATLKRDDQELIQARFEKGLSFVEQAQARGTTPDAVRVRTGRALVKLLNEMNRSETATPAPSNPGPSATRDDRTLGEDYSLILEAARLPSPGPTSD